LPSITDLSGLAGRTTAPVLIGVFVAGALLHFLTLLLRDHGPSFGSIALNGNGASIVLVLDLLGILIAEAICVKRRTWLAMLLLPV
jgi:hypothetical protein